MGEEQCTCFACASKMASVNAEISIKIMGKKGLKGNFYDYNCTSNTIGYNSMYSICTFDDSVTFNGAKYYLLYRLYHGWISKLLFQVDEDILFFYLDFCERPAMLCIAYDIQFPFAAVSSFLLQYSFTNPIRRDGKHQQLIEIY